MLALRGAAAWRERHCALGASSSLADGGDTPLMRCESSSGARSVSANAAALRQRSPARRTAKRAPDDDPHRVHPGVRAARTEPELGSCLRPSLSRPQSSAGEVVLRCCSGRASRRRRGATPVDAVLPSSFGADKTSARADDRLDLAAGLVQRSAAVRAVGLARHGRGACCRAGVLAALVVAVRRAGGRAMRRRSR